MSEIIGEWALIVFSGPVNGAGSVDLGKAHHSEIVRQQVSVQQKLPVNQTVPVSNEVTEQSVVRNIGGSVNQVQTVASIFVRGIVKVETSQVQAAVRGIDETACFTSLVGQQLTRELAARYDAHCLPATVAFVTAQAANAAIRATEVVYVETHGMGFSCEACPDGIDRKEDRASVAPLTASAREFRFQAFESTQGSVDVQGMSSLVLIGGNKIDASIDGALRLPLVRSTCEECRLSSEDSTWLVQGKIDLREMQGNSNNLWADMEGDLTSFKLDEFSVDPGLFSAPPVATAAAVIGLAALVKLLVIPLFTRLSREKALEHPRRKAIFDYIHEHPGANFREVARNTGIAAGTVRHHLNVLRRSEVIVEHAHGSTVRLFENQLKFQQNWADLVLLREPSLGLLYDWLKANPGAPQKGVLEGMEAHGWSRSTTQHRLARLVDGGLATIRLQGRLKIYTAVDRSASPRPASFGIERPGPAAPA